MSEPWAHRPTVKDHLTSARFLVLRAGFVLGLLVTIGLEDAARAAASLVRRTLHS